MRSLSFLLPLWLVALATYFLPQVPPLKPDDFAVVDAPPQPVLLLFSEDVLEEDFFGEEPVDFAEPPLLVFQL